MNVMSARAMGQYKQVETRVGADSADPHQLIIMLFDGVLERIAVAKGAIYRNDIEEKGQKIGRAIAILDGLRGALNSELGGDISDNLDRLYDYMQRRLFDANLNSDVLALDEVADLIKEIKSAWAAIPFDMRQSEHA